MAESMQIGLVRIAASLSGRNTLLRGAFFLLIGIGLLRKLFDPDIWWHMVVGREVVRQMRVPDYEFYILPRLGEPGEFHEWGFDVFYYLIEHHFGFVGMAIANAAIGCGILWTLYLAQSRARAEWWQSIPVISLVLWIIEPRLNFRPETLLFLFLAAEIFLLENYLVRKKVAWLTPLPLFTWLLSQGHPSAIFLIGVFGVYSLQAVFASEGRIKTASVLGIIMLAMVVTATLNPYGFHQLWMPFDIALTSEELKSITEFLPVLQTEYASRYIVVVAAGLAAILLAPPRRLVDILLFVIFSILAFRYARNIALLAIVAYVPINSALMFYMARLAKTPAHKGAIALFSICVGMAGIVAVATSEAWGVGIYGGNTPYKSALLLKRFAAQGNILNFYHLGSYLAWELDRPIFVDGKNYGTNKAVELHNAIFRADPGWQNVISLFNIQAIVTPVTLDFSGQIIPLVTILENDPDWVLVGQEEAGLMFVRNTGQESIPPLPKETIWRQAIEELNGTIKLYPGSKEAYRSLATAYGHVGDTAQQRYYLEKYMSL